jgi:hypothetical protein
LRLSSQVPKPSDKFRTRFQPSGGVGRAGAWSRFAIAIDLSIFGCRLLEQTAPAVLGPLPCHLAERLLAARALANVNLEPFSRGLAQFVREKLGQLLG